MKDLYFNDVARGAVNAGGLLFLLVMMVMM